MFTGIVETTAVLLELDEVSGGYRLVLDTSKLGSTLRAGDSLAVNGVCLTAVDPTPDRCTFDVIQETIRRSSFSDLTVGAALNIEPSLRADARFDGHFVQGHVDVVTEVDEVVTDDDSWTLWLRLDDDLRPYIVPKGSVCINGVSMTVACVEAHRFSVALIPTTLERTNLGSLVARQRVNIETDIIVRTVLHQLRLIQGSVQLQNSE